MILYAFFPKSFQHFTLFLDGVESSLVTRTERMKKEKIKKEYNYNFLIGFLFIWTILIGFSFVKVSTIMALQGYEYMLANINGI